MRWGVIDIHLRTLYKQSNQKMISIFRHRRRTDGAAFDALFRASYASLYRHAFALLNDAEDSRDVVGEVFARVLEKEMACDELEPAYLMTMVHNKALDLLRHRKVEDEARQSLSYEYRMLLQPEGEREERLTEILRFIETQLTPQTQKILRMCYAEKMSYKEVAQELNISTQAVNKHISQALKALRQRFNPQ